MPLKSGRFTDQEIAFVRHYCRCQNATAAAELAEYKHPKMAGYTLMQRPAILREVERFMFAMSRDNALKGHGVIADMLEPGSKYSERTKLGAATVAIKDYRERLAMAQGAGQAKELHEMSADEIAARIIELEGKRADLLRAASDRALLVEGETVEDEHSQGEDIFA